LLLASAALLVLMALEFSWLHMLRPLAHRLLDGLMTGNMDHYASQPVVLTAS